MNVYPQSIPSFGCIPSHGRRMKLFSTFKKFHTHKTFIPTNSGIRRKHPQASSVSTLRSIPSPTKRRDAWLRYCTTGYQARDHSWQIQTFPNLFFVFSILKNHTLKTYPRMDAAWKKGAYPGKRVHTLHGLQKKAVRYTQVSHDKIAFRISITVSPISIEWTVR